MLEIFWLKPDGDRVLNGSIARGRDLVISTTIGHRFVVVDLATKAERIIESHIPIQGVSISESNGGLGEIPSFYAQHADDHRSPWQGDSIANSISEVLACLLGYLLASRFRFRWSLGLIVITEIVMLMTIRDSRLLNVIMLISPIEAIKQWQSALSPYAVR